MPLPHEIWRAGLRPAVNILLGLTGLGVIGMLVKQLVIPKDAPAPESARVEEPTKSEKSAGPDEGVEGGGHE